MPREVVPMEMRPGRPSDIFSIMRWKGSRTCARLLMQRLPATVDAGGLQHFDLGEQRGRIDHQAVADHRLLARPQNAARNQLENELLVADPDRVAGVVAALVAGHDVEMRSEKRSTIFPLPSSPHWAPRIMIFRMETKPEYCSAWQRRKLRKPKCHICADPLAGCHRRLVYPHFAFLYPECDILRESVQI